MSQLDAINFSDALKKRLVDFSLDNNFVRDTKLIQICRNIWAGNPKDGGLVSDLWVEGAFPAMTSNNTLLDLVEAGKYNLELCNYLDNVNAVPKNRLLYSHQQETILKAQDTYPNQAKPSLVVTAGTGAGKTESFLLPILNDLYQHSNNSGNGVKCIILYPMNALVNDQVDRLYTWLKGQKKVTLFHFTSETPENKKQADRDNVPIWEVCRMRTRQQARGIENLEGKQIDFPVQAPDILITNYSMLEYMLCRPQDAVFFGNALRTIVLDEAHLYTGTLAAEITLLLRRVLVRCQRSPEDILHIATSATIGTSDLKELELFAATLFTKDPSLVKIVQGKQMPLTLDKLSPPKAPVNLEEVIVKEWLTSPTITIDKDGITSVLATNLDACDKLASSLPLLVSEDIVKSSLSESAGCLAQLLYKTLAESPIIHQLANILWERKRLPLRELSKHLWETDNDEAVWATTELLKMGASAREEFGAYPLIPHRIHLLTRSADGLVICLNSDCSGEATLKISPFGAISAGVYDNCVYCKSATVSIHRCTNCGEWILASSYDGKQINPIAGIKTSLPIDYLSQQPVDGATELIVNAKGQIQGAGEKGIKLYLVENCPRCGMSGEEAWRPFISQSPLTLSILTETALAELPEYSTSHNLWLPARGRRLLVFSDNRQEAARLGPHLTRQHEVQLIRAALVECLRKNIADEGVIQDLKDEILRVETDLLRPNLTEAQTRRLKQNLANTRQELVNINVGGSLDHWIAQLAEETFLQEIIDAESALKHEFGKWNQHSWDLNFEAVKSRLVGLVGRELVRPVRQATSLESIGLAEITYPGLENLNPPDQLGLLPTIDARKKISENWTSLLAALCDSLRRDGVITLGSIEEDRTYQFGNAFIGHWVSEETSYGNWLLRFVGATKRHIRRRFIEAILLKCGLNDEEASSYAVEILQIAYRQLQANSSNENRVLSWLESRQRQSEAMPIPALRIVFSKLGLRRPINLYRCHKTGHIWPRSVLGCAPEVGCTELEQVSHDNLDSDPRVGRQRREFQTSKVFRTGLWAEEHSAQLAPKENRRLQDLFKSGVRNILSSTTTLELGIDIGGLNAVLMSNVPPGKANYLQRAGRAGRRADGSSVVVTFCRLRPFDREVFLRFGDYLDRPLRRPRVILDRVRIARRHAQAYLLGEFFREILPPKTKVGAMRAFGIMGEFCGLPLPYKWTSGSEKPPLPEKTVVWQPEIVPNWYNPESSNSSLEEHFINYLLWIRDFDQEKFKSNFEQLLQDTSLSEVLTNWSDFLNDVIESFSTSIKEWHEEYRNLLLSWNSVSSSHLRARSQANAIHYQLLALYETTVIEALADKQFLPRYGFPISVHKLRVIIPDEDRSGQIREEEQYRLERGGLLALREYIPGSQLLVGGKLITSHGLLKHWTGANLDNYIGLQGKYTYCVNNHFYYEISHQLKNCPICGEVARESARDLLLPKHGFSTAAWDPPKNSTDIERVGKTERATISFAKSDSKVLTEKYYDFGDVTGLTALYQESGELLVYNRGDFDYGFAICLKCGYTDSEADGSGVPSLSFQRHSALMETNPYKKCWKDNEQPVITNRTLAAKERTDILLIDFFGCLPSYASYEPLIWTLAYALQIAGAKLLELDSREIGVLCAPSGQFGRSLGAVLYDNVPGGAGHVRELLSFGREWLLETEKTLWVNEKHNEYCKTACLDCLLTFDGQEAVDKGLLKRKIAYDVLHAILHGEQLPIISDSNGINGTVDNADSLSESLKDANFNLFGEPVQQAKPSNDERLRRAQERLAKQKPKK